MEADDGDGDVGDDVHDRHGQFWHDDGFHDADGASSSHSRSRTFAPYFILYLRVSYIITLLISHQT